MQPSDEYILEALQEEGNLTAQALGEMDVCAANTARHRLPILTDYGLVQRISTGLYRITEEGEAFLDGDLDASTLDADGDRE